MTTKMDKICEGLMRSDYAEPMKRQLLERLVNDAAFKTNIPEADLKAIFSLAFSYILSYESSNFRRSIGTRILIAFSSGQSQFLDRYLGHEIIIDLFNRAALPAPFSSSSSSAVLSSHRIRLSNPNDNYNGNNSAGSSVVASPMSVSGPPTPSTGPASPTGSTSSLLAGGSTTMENSDSGNNNGEDSLSGHSAGIHSSLDIENGGASGGTAKKSTTNQLNITAASTAASSPSSIRDDADDAAISASVSRQKGICKSTAAISPTALLEALAICLESLSAGIGEGGMVRRHKVIAALVGKLLQAHHTSMDVAFSLVHFLNAHSDCIPIGESAEVLIKSFIQCLAPARPRRSSDNSSGKVVFDLNTFMRQVSFVSKFLPRLWTGASVEPSSADADLAGTPRGAVVALQTTFEILLSPKPTNNGPSRNVARGEPFMPLVGVLNQIPHDVREKTALALAQNRDITDAQLATMLGRMCCWILLLPIWNFTPTIVDWVGAIVKQMAAEWRFTPLINVCEAESANLWKVAMLQNKRIIVRESALKILAELMLAYQHDPRVYFDKISYDIISSLPELVSDPNSSSLLTPISNLVLGLLRIHGLPPSFTLNRHIYTTLNELPGVDVMELERYIHRVQWNSKRHPRGWVGLYNLGNTCFANSVIQALRACSEFTRDVLALVPSTSVITLSHFSSASNSNNTTNQIIAKFQFLLARLVFSQRPLLKPEEFLLISRPPWFVWKAQQDCNEYLKFFMDTLHETEKAGQQHRQQTPDNGQQRSVDLSSTTVLRNFGGKVESSYTCHHCLNVSMREEIFTDLPLPFVDAEQQRQCQQPDQESLGTESTGMQPPSKVLCSEENGVRTKQKSALATDTYNTDTYNSNSNAYYDCLDSPPTEELAGIGVDGDDEAGGDADQGDGRTSRLCNNAPKVYQPATPAPSRSPSPAPKLVNAFANDAIMEEEEEETEDVGSESMSAGTSIPESETSSRRADSATDLTEIGLSELNAVSAKLQQFQSEGSQRMEKWNSEEKSSATSDEPQPTVLPAILSAALPPPPPPFTSNDVPSTSKEASNLALSHKNIATPSTSKPYILQDLLDAYFQPETLEGANAYRCERCEGLRTATQRTVMKESPEYLILTLMRFKYDIEEKRRNKINDPVVISETLSVPLNGGTEAIKEPGGADSTASVSQSSFCSATSQVTPASHILPSSASTETLTNDHSSSFVRYRLLAVVIHQGESPEAGHYFTYVRTHPESNAVMGPASSGWIQFNDAFAKEADEGVMDKVLNTNLTEATSSVRSTETPYVLFFEKMQGRESSPGTKREGDLGPLIKGIAPTLVESNRLLISADNRRWLKESEHRKLGGKAAPSSAAVAVDKTLGKPPDDDDKKGGGGPCGGQGFGSLGNGPRFVC